MESVFDIPINQVHRKREYNPDKNPIYKLKEIKEIVKPKVLKTKDMFDFGEDASKMPKPEKPKPIYQTRFQKYLDTAKTADGHDFKPHKY